MCCDLFWYKEAPRMLDRTSLYRREPLPEGPRHWAHPVWTGRYVHVFI